MYECVVECQFFVYIYVEVDDGIVMMYVIVFLEVLMMRGFVSILVQGIMGFMVDEVFVILEDYLQLIGFIKVVLFLWIGGMMGMFMCVKNQVRKKS